MFPVNNTTYAGTAGPVGEDARSPIIWIYSLPSHPIGPAGHEERSVGVQYHLGLSRLSHLLHAMPQQH